MSEDEPTGRDLRTIKATIAYVGGGLVAVGGLLVLVISWGSGQSETNVAQSLKMDGMQKEIDANSKRLDALERFREFHQRNHVQHPSSGGFQGRP